MSLPVPAPGYDVIDALRLGLRRLFDARLRTALTVGSIAAGTALVVSVFGLYGSLTGSAQRLVDLSGDAALEVTSLSDTGVDEDLVGALDDLDTVEAAVPTIRSTVGVGGQRALLVGLDERITELGGPVDRVLERTLPELDGRESALDGLFVGQPLAEDLGLAEGGSVEVVAPGGDVTDVEVALVVPEEDSTGVNQGRFVAAVLPVAQELAGQPSTVDSIALVPVPGTSRDRLRTDVEAAVGDRVSVQDPDVLLSQATAATESLQQVVLVIAGMALFVSAFVVFNTMTMVALLRRQDLATVRAIGASRYTIARELLIEAGLLGLAGAALGVPLGIAVARWIVYALPPGLVASVGLEIEPVMPAYAIPLASGIAVVVSVLAAAPAAWRAMRVPPVESMRAPGMLETAGEGERVQPRPVLAGLVFMGAGLGIAFGAPRGLLPVAPGALAFGAVLISYGLMKYLTRGAAWITASFGTAGRLAAVAVGRAPRRVWATSAVIAVTLAVAIAVSGVVANTNDSIRRNVAPLGDGDLYVQTTRNDDFPTDLRMPDSTIAEVGSIPGVADVREGQFAFVDVGHDRILVQAVGHIDTRSPLFQWAKPEAQAEVLEGSGLIVSTAFSQRYDVARGDVFELATPRGAKPLRIVDVVDSFIWPQGVLMISLERMRTWFDRPGASWIELDIDSSRPFADVRADVEQVTAEPFPLVVMSAEESVDQSLGAFGQVNSIFLAMQWIMVASAGMAVLNTFAISVIDRRRELGVLRAMGSGQRQIRRVVLLEAGGLTALGCLIGTGMGLLLHYVSADVSARLMTFPIEYAFSSKATAVAAVATAAAATLGSSWPAWQAVRSTIIEAIGYE